nr:serine/threonine-protein phosphatase [Lachnospiraceae bacterium]
MSRDKEIRIRTDGSERVALAGYTVIGDRDEQQDVLCYLLDERGCLALVCDGMGGQSGGALAAQTAAETVQKRYESCPDPQDSLQSVIEAVREADRQIAALTDEQGRPLEAGSTVTAVLVQDCRLGWCSVGDSRAYLMRGADLVQFTQDQNYKSVLDEQRKLGLIGEEEYRKESCYGNTLISYLGIGNLELIDYSSPLFSLEEGDRLLLASDGLYRVLSEEDICGVLTDFNNPEDALAVLEQKAGERAENAGILRDNTSVILITVK